MAMEARAILSNSYDLSFMEAGKEFYPTDADGGRVLQHK